VGAVKVVNLHHRAKICGDRSNRCGDMAIFHFQDGGHRHLGILKFRNFNRCNGQENETASLRQISWPLVKLLQRYGDFSIFPRWRRPPS